MSSVWKYAIDSIEVETGRGNPSWPFVGTTDGGVQIISCALKYSGTSLPVVSKLEGMVLSTKTSVLFGQNLSAILVAAS